MLNLKFQSGGIFGICIGLLAYKYFDLEPLWIFVTFFFILSFVIWVYSSKKEHKEKDKQK